jgi:hypothetical protein
VAQALTSAQFRLAGATQGTRLPWVEPEDDPNDEGLLDRRQVSLDPEAFDALQRRVDAPGERRAGAVELFERRKALDELVAISEELGLYDIDATSPAGSPHHETFS